jgi:ABC-2 type transport system ATP-binding protein
MKIEVRDLVVRYGRRTAVDHVSFAVEPGAVWALLGRNGAGKSSLVKVLLGQRPANAGTVKVCDLDPWRQRARLMRSVAATPETPDAPPGLTVAAIERFTAPLYPRWDGAGFKARLERFGVPLRQKFGELSRGQRALVMLALALAPRPDLLILDDPTLGLDPLARRFVFEELIAELAERGVTVFLTSHDLAGVERVATHVGILDAGRLVAEGELEALREQALAAGVETPTLEELFADRVGGGALP